MNKVVITGMGMVSPLGLDTETSWESLKAGVGVRQPIDLFETEGCRCREGAQVDLPQADRSERRLSRASRLAIMAAKEAMRQACLNDRPFPQNFPLCVSTTGGAMEWGETFLRGALAVKPDCKLAHVARYHPQQQVIDLQHALGVEGPVTMIGNACASGANAIGHGFDLIRSELADCVMVGGYEAMTELIFMGFDCLQALSVDCCRPFDLYRNGLMLGEGAAFLVLESEKHAQTRSANILGRILGYGHAMDLHHLTQPSPHGQALITAMQNALAGAEVEPHQITYINAHGTGTPANDQAEALSYIGVFGESLPEIAVSSTKAAIGHTLGAAGGLETVFTLCAARECMAPPQLHNQSPLPEVAKSLAGINRTLKKGQPVMSVNLGFGGSNAALVLSL